MSQIDKSARLDLMRSAHTKDGMTRPEDAENRLDDLCRRVLNTRDGEMLMDYIKSITTSVVLPASATDAELRSQEGMRKLCAILDTRRRSQPFQATDPKERK